MTLRKKLVAAAAVTAVSALALAGCGSNTADKTDQSGASSGSSSSSGAGKAALTIAKPDGALTTESHNPYLGDSTASMYGYRLVIWEPVALINPTGDLETTRGWLRRSNGLMTTLN